jgi:hypothetical protein
MYADRLILVLIAFAASLACRAHRDPAFVQLAEARRLVSEMRLDFSKASDASDRSVMADTDEESIKFAREAQAATEAVSGAMTTLTRLLTELAYPGNAELVTRLQERFAHYRSLDREILKLAVENTNLKAQRLLFGPVDRAANEFCSALRAVAAAVPASTARHITDAVASAQLAVREIQVLEAPHIAEAKDAEMDRLEHEMALRQATAREALKAIEQSVRPPVPSSLDVAKASLDTFETLSRKLIELSRKNTNVRSLELALKQKPALTSGCEESLAALQHALASQGFSGTR